MQINLRVNKASISAQWWKVAGRLWREQNMKVNIVQKPKTSSYNWYKHYNSIRKSYINSSIVKAYLCYVGRGWLVSAAVKNGNEENRRKQGALTLMHATWSGSVIMNPSLQKMNYMHVPSWWNSSWVQEPYWPRCKVYLYQRGYWSNEKMQAAGIIKIFITAGAISAEEYAVFKELNILYTMRYINRYQCAATDLGAFPYALSE